jgi:cobalamin biosynthesis Mg chelatase CobN
VLPSLVRVRSRTDEQAIPRTSMPFPILALLLVLLIVAALFIVYYLTRRW